MTIRMSQSLAAWGEERYRDLLRDEIERLPHHALPLQQGLRYSSLVSDDPIEAVILKLDETPVEIRVTASLFYRGVIAGCSCADDPTPLDSLNENCTLLIRIDKATAEARFELLQEESD